MDLDPYPYLYSMQSTHHSIGESWTFKNPQKFIASDKDLDLFRQSALFRELIDFLNQLSAPLKGSPLDSDRLSKASPQIKQLVNLLDTIDQWVNDIPPSEGAMRFGNSAFRTWFDRLQQVRLPMDRFYIR